MQKETFSNSGIYKGHLPGAKNFSEQFAPAHRFIPSRNQPNTMETEMLYWALIFFVVAIIAGVFGFGGIASASAGIAQILFVIFLVLFVVAMIARAARGRTP